MSAPPSQLAASPATVFELPTGPVAVAGAETLAAELADCLLDWPARPRRATDASAEIRVTRLPEPAVEAVVLPGGRVVAAEPLFVANALAGALTAEIPRREPAWVQVHAAAALDAGGRLDLFLGASQAGKSTLALALARGGRRLFADDRLMLRLAPAGVTGLGLAVAPKLRLPAPADWDAATLAWVEARTSRALPGLAYLRLPPAELARLGETAPVARIVVLSRAADPAPAALRPAPPAQALRALLPQCFAPRLSAAALLAWAERLVAAVPTFRLDYAAAAAALPALAPAGTARE